MIQKIADPGAGFRGTLNYDLAAKKKPELIGGNMAGETARELAHEFGLGRALNLQVGKPVFHASLTAAPADQLSEDDWRRFATLYMERLGYGECQQALIRHHDTERDHVHVVANRIDRHGRRVDDFLERKRGEAIVRDLERDFGLTQVAPSSASLRAAPGRGELAAFARTGQVAGKARLQEHIDLAARGGPPLPELAEKLQLQGVGVRAHVATTGRLSGLSFELDGFRCKGSDLGRGYSWPGLAARTGASYEPERDLPRLRELGVLKVREGAVASAPDVPEAGASSVHAAPPAPPSRMPETAEEQAAPMAPAIEAPVAPAPPANGSAAAAPPGLSATAREALCQRLRAEVDRAAAGGPTLPEFADRLRRAGVEMHANVASTGRLSGLSFEVEGLRVKGSELGRDYAWRALAARHGVSFVPARDAARLGCAGAVAAAGAPAIEPLPVPPRVPVYRAAAVLVSRAEVLGQVETLTAQLGEQDRAARQAAAVAEARVEQERAADDAVRAAIDRDAGAIYVRPEEARRQLHDLVAGQGLERAAAAVEGSPELLGQLRGLGVGGLRSPERRSALAAAGRLSAELRAVAARGERLAAAGDPMAAPAARQLEQAGAQLRRLARAFGRLPDRQQLEKEMVGAAVILGERLTARLAPAALAKVILGRAARVVRDLVRGRDDQFLGR
jgi:hypothetical protein